MLQLPINTLDKLLEKEDTAVVFEGQYHVELVVEVNDASTHSRQMAMFMVPAAEYSFRACNTPRAIFTTFPTFYKRVAAMQLPHQTICTFSVIVVGPIKWQVSVNGPFNDFLSFGVTILF